MSSMKASGRALTQEAIDFCGDIFAKKGAILCGPGGSRFVYDLRAAFDLYCKYTPLLPVGALEDCGIFIPGHLDRINILAVRENTGGLYFGESTVHAGTDLASLVSHRFTYSRLQVRRILESAFAAARCRRFKLSITTKPCGIPAISELWREQAELLGGKGDVEVSILEIDNAAYQIIANPSKFDVIVSPNMFGDVMADIGALLLGSRGMSYSGNFGSGGKAVYQTGHGAAYDIAGKDLANPIGQMMSAAMMLRESFGLSQAAECVESAIRKVLLGDFRTADISSGSSKVIGTKEMGRCLVEAVKGS